MVLPLPLRPNKRSHAFHVVNDNILTRQKILYMNTPKHDYQ
ncbi:hypothetical protein BGS_0399 [Beggiatoa sp. SS]|nr:hypothetical protein BGS_0399 [Beggiatoa sp. SS]